MGPGARGRVRVPARRRGEPGGADRPVGGRVPRRVHRPPRRAGAPARGRGAGAAARRARRGERRGGRRRARWPQIRFPGVDERLGGELAPFQWAAVRYALQARRTFLADEQGLGKTVEALAAARGRRRLPGGRRLPGLDEAQLGSARRARWLGHRSVAVIEGRVAVPPSADITILNYEIVAAHREALARRRPRAIVIDESHYCKNPQAKRTQAVRRLAGAVPADGLRLALTGTPVLNHADELIAQLRVIGRLEDFGSGARFSRQFQGERSEERLHWHLRRRCFVRRLKSEVLPQLPAKRQVVVPMALTNASEYRLAERDVIEWLRAQPLDLSELNAKIAAALRAERLAQLGTLQRLAARGKLHAALGWIADFLVSGEPLVVFARHVEVQEAVLARFPDALHLLGRDSTAAREAAVRAFQSGDGSAADRLRHPRRGPGDHAHTGVQRRLPRARVDAGDARPGRGPLPPHRPARRGHRLVSARRRDDRRDDGPPDPAQARDRRRGHRRPRARRRRPRRAGRARAARRAAPSRTCARCRGASRRPGRHRARRRAATGDTGAPARAPRRGPRRRHLSQGVWSISNALAALIDHTPHRRHRRAGTHRGVWSLPNALAALIDHTPRPPTPARGHPDGALRSPGRAA